MQAVPAPNTSNNCNSYKVIKVTFIKINGRMVNRTHPLFFLRLDHFFHCDCSFSDFEVFPFSRQVQNTLSGNAGQNQSVERWSNQLSLYENKLMDPI